MSERFIRLYELQNNLYSTGSPVIVSAGALLKDTQTNNIIVQLKFHSVCVTPIKALQVGIAAFDIAGKEIEGVDEYQYLDLNIQNGYEFGSNKAIVMPDVVTRSFSVRNITAVLANGNIQDVSMPMTALPKTTSLQSRLKDAELVKQYKLAVNDESTYIPQETDDLWMCSCGEWNSTSKCCKCRCDRSTVFDSLELEALTEKMATRLATEREQSEEQARILEIARQEQAERDRIAAEKEAERRKVQKKKLTFAAMIAAPILVIILVFSLWVCPTFIKPMVIEKQFHEAIITLQESASHSEEDVLEALSLVMTTGLNNRLKYADNSTETDREEYSRNLLSAEAHLLDIGDLDIDNKTVRNAFSTYVDGLKMQNQVFDRYTSSLNSNFDDLTSEYAWITGARIRSSAIVTLYKEGLLTLTAEDYGEYCATYIESQLEKALIGTITASPYDNNHYCFTATLKNDTLADFEGFEVLSLWNDEEVYASIDIWESGETWNAEFIVSDSSLERDNISLEFSAYFDNVTVKSPNQ